MKHLVAEEVQLFHVCFRWMNCFFTREIPLEAVLRLWDTYIAEGTSGFSEFHIYVCAGTLKPVSSCAALCSKPCVTFP